MQPTMTRKPPAQHGPLRRRRGVAAVIWLVIGLTLLRSLTGFLAVPHIVDDGAGKTVVYLCTLQGLQAVTVDDPTQPPPSPPSDHAGDCPACVLNLLTHAPVPPVQPAIALALTGTVEPPDRRETTRPHALDLPRLHPIRAPPPLG